MTNSNRVLNYEDERGKIVHACCISNIFTVEKSMDGLIALTRPIDSHLNNEDITLKLMKVSTSVLYKPSEDSTNHNNP